MALETEFGRKRRINQSSCNQDFSCLNGFCPSFVTLRGAQRITPRPLAAAAVPSLPEPRQAALDGVHNVLIAGVGGTGVVTASGLLGLAAHLEGKVVHQLDQTGLAQKYGAVLSHVRIAAAAERAARHADTRGAGRPLARRRLDRRRGQGAVVDAVAGSLGRHRQHARGDAVGLHPRPRLRVSRQAARRLAAERRGGRAPSRRSMPRASRRRCSATASARTY